MDGQRVAKKEGGGGRQPWIIAGAVVGVLAAAYLGTCAWAAGRSTILPNVSVAGVDVSNMTMEQAKGAIASTVEQKGGNFSFIMAYEDMEENLTLDQLAVDAGQSAQNAWDIGRGNFFTGGPKLVGHMLGMSSQVPVVLPEDDPAVMSLVDRMEERISAATEDHGYQVEGDRLVMTKGASVVTIDWETMKADLFDHSLPSAFETLAEGGDEYRVSLYADQSETEEPDFEAIHRAVYAQPKDASLNVETMEVTDHAVGIDFDVETLKTAYENAKSGEDFSVPLTVTQPKVTKEDLEGQLFRDVLGEGTTHVSGSANRKHNVKLAAEACNNKILLPGEEFSYNTTTGSRTVEKGYREAPIYAGSKSESGVGGGVCQPSSTIYFAVLHTNLEVVERHAHGFNTGYVEPGMDATVFFGVQDFRFKNSTDYPIKIVTNSYDGKGGRYLNVKIYGTNPDGVYAVPRSNQFNRVSPTTVYKPDPNVPQGTLVLDREQYAYVGISAQTYRDIYAKDGTLLETQDMGKSKYNMRPNTYYYNPADGDPASWPDGKPPAPPSTDPGSTQPEDPGTVQPENPGVTQPEDPGVTQPEDPGTDQPPTDPTTPPSSDSGINPITPEQAPV